MNTRLVLWTYDTTAAVADTVAADHVDYLNGLLASGDLVAVMVSSLDGGRHA